jgi:hypothetical protein
MAKGKCTFRKTDITRLFSAAATAGVKVARVEVQAGKLTLIPDNECTTPEGSKSSESKINPWDEVLIHAADQKRAS